MRCKKVIRQLSVYLDGQLTAAERKAVRSHIAGCARCRGELETLSRTVYAVADLPRLQAPSDLRDQVMAKLDPRSPASVEAERSGPAPSSVAGRRTEDGGFAGAGTVSSSLHFGQRTFLPAAATGAASFFPHEHATVILDAGRAAGAVPGI